MFYWTQFHLCCFMAIPCYYCIMSNGNKYNHYWWNKYFPYFLVPVGLLHNNNHISGDQYKKQSGVIFHPITTECLVCLVSFHLTLNRTKCFICKRDQSWSRTSCHHWCQRASDSSWALSDLTCCFFFFLSASNWKSSQKIIQVSSSPLTSSCKWTARMLFYTSSQTLHSLTTRRNILWWTNSV